MAKAKTDFPPLDWDREEKTRLKARVRALEAALEVALPCVQALADTQRAMGHDYICTAEIEQMTAALERGAG